VANAEGAAGGLKGTTAGKNWAWSAKQHFEALGMPAGRPIYFSVDWDAGSGDWAAIDAALRGAATVIGASRVGVYGSYDTIRHCQDAKTASWFWQTYAWSGGKWATGVHLQQYKNGVKIGLGDCDLNRSMVADYGQWGYASELEDDMGWDDAIYNAPKGNPASNPPGPRTAREILGALDSRSGYLANNLGLQIAKSVQTLLQQQGINTDQLKAAIDNVDEEVVAKLGDSGQSVDETAQLLVSLLGDRSLAVAQAVIKATGAPSS
jgi:hypothetical protein